MCCRVWLMSLCAMLVLMTGQLQADDADLPRQAVKLLKERCYRCHGGSAKQAGIDVLSRDNLVAERGEAGGDKFAIVVPGDAKSSKLIQAIIGDSAFMPEQGSPEDKAWTPADAELIQRWVNAGAEFPKDETRPFLSETDAIKAMREHLLTVKADDRKHVRFFTLTHLYNNPTISELDLRLHRAALSKAINSLTKSRDLILPKALPNTGESVFVVDLFKLGWSRNNLWGEILSHYPYALKYDFVADEALKQVWKDVSQFSGADVPFVRADWFVVTATQPPLYHQLLDIPETLMELEKNLQLKIHENFVNGDVQRSGYAKSGVSKQNRMLERHTTPVTPYFWISYDFLPKRARGDLSRFPLGPQFPGNPFNSKAFDHDGGEIIWSLPNGMQAYMLVNAKGNRIDAGPVEVVFDRSAVLETPQIINGISCMYCHRQGMIADFRDELRNARSLGGKAEEHLRQIHVPHDEMQSLTRQDQELFLRALERVTGPFLKVGEDADKPITQFPEPIGKVAGKYARDLNPLEVARELGYADVAELQGLIRGNRLLREWGLGALADNPPGTLKREKWETREGTTLMQDVAVELNLGHAFTPPRQ